jgi:TRAP-type C4-dicarboxylate transport system substrate-binding protein
MDAAIKAANFERKVIRDNEVKMVADLKSWGMQVDNVDKMVFIKSMQPVYDRFYKEHPSWSGLVEKIKAAR